MWLFEHNVLHLSWETVLFICLTDISFNKYSCIHLVSSFTCHLSLCVLKPLKTDVQYQFFAELNIAVILFTPTQSNILC